MEAAFTKQSLSNCLNFDIGNWWFHGVFIDYAPLVRATWKGSACGMIPIFVRGSAGLSCENLPHKSNHRHSHLNISTLSAWLSTVSGPPCQQGMREFLQIGGNNSHGVIEKLFWERCMAFHSSLSPEIRPVGFWSCPTLCLQAACDFDGHVSQAIVLLLKLYTAQVFQNSHVHGMAPRDPIAWS